MNVILIDDEYLALEYLEHQMCRISTDVNIVGKYLNPLDGKAAVCEQEVDVVFLDIRMPGCNGMELADQLIAKKPDLHIVFVTAHDEYAVQAFELNALDYVLKPVSAQRLEKTLQRITDVLASKQAQAEMTESSHQAKNALLHVQMFQQLMIHAGEAAVQPRWRTIKAQELFMYMLQNRGQLLRKPIVLEALWPEYELDKAYSSLYTSIYHIRKTLKEYADHLQIVNQNDGYLLVMNHAVTDVELFEQYLQKNLEVSDETIDRYEQIMSLYKDDYMKAYDYWWLEGERTRLRQLWLRAALSIAGYYESAGMTDEAIRWYNSICDRQPLTEEAHFALMKVYAARNNHLYVHRQYRILQQVIQEELNEQPSRYIHDWYDHWKGTIQSS
jgi:two-component SAPR family response regulator